MGPMLVTLPCEPAPRLVDGAHDAVAVVAGGEHACLRDANGGVRCWGADHFGQLGDGASGPDVYQVKPIEVSGLSDVQRLALGASHTCAITGKDGGLRCWGDNAFGQLGIGTDALDSNKITPTPVPDVTGLVDLAAADRTTCAARADGSVLCWGDTATVLPASPKKDGTALVPTLVPGLAGAIAARTGGAHACALRGDGTVICWGANDRGQLGNGGVSPTDFSMVPVMAAETEVGTPG
jgi:alpha-tubulin suppressor-like RCC1 family protein